MSQKVDPPSKPSNVLDERAWIDIQQKLGKHVRIDGRGLDDSTLEDVVGNALTALLEKLKSDPPRDPLVYAKGIASNKLKDAWKARSRARKVAREVPEDVAPSLEIAEGTGDERLDMAIQALRKRGETAESIARKLSEVGLEMSQAEAARRMNARGASQDVADDAREAILDECHRRFLLITGHPWTEELAARIREAIEPKPSIEPRARAIFEELRTVLRRADRFIAAHGRELNAHLVDSVDEWCRQRDAANIAYLQRCRQEENDDAFFSDVAQAREHGFEITRDYLEALAKTYGVTLEANYDIDDPAILVPDPEPPPPPTSVPEPREWGPATDFLRMFLQQAGPLPDAITAEESPWPPLVVDARGHAIERLSSGWIPWDFYLDGRAARTDRSTPLRPEEIAPVTILLGLCDWGPLLKAASTAKSIRHEAKLIDGVCRRREGKLTTVIRVDPERRSSELVQVPITGPGLARKSAK